MSDSGFGGKVIWLTGLPASGKTTIGKTLVATLVLYSRRPAYLLDGDELRKGLNEGLDYTREGRREACRRAAHAAKILQEAGVTPVVAMVSPYREDRDAARALFPVGGFMEVHVHALVSTCIERDPKGLYAQAVRGERDFAELTGPYEEPRFPELVLHTHEQSVVLCVRAICAQVLHTS